MTKPMSDERLTKLEQYANSNNCNQDRLAEACREIRRLRTDCAKQAKMLLDWSPPEERIVLHEEISRLRALLKESNAVCACGCPIGAHENYGEDGMSCDKGHECVPTGEAVLAMLAGLRNAIQIQEDKLGYLKQVERDLRSEIVARDAWLRSEIALKDASIKRYEAAMRRALEKYDSADRVDTTSTLMALILRASLS